MRKSQGFILMKRVVIVVIVSFLAALFAFSVHQRLKPSKQAAAREHLAYFSVALNQFYRDLGRYPSTREGLAALREQIGNVEKWKGPYLNKEIPKDPWGSAYNYRALDRNGSYEIITYGADGKAGGDDENKDITNE